MIRNILLVCSVLCLWGCASKEKKEQLEDPETTVSQTTPTVPKSLDDIAIYNFDELEPLLHQDDGKVHVVNFWATWCGPCVKELPYFERIHADLQDQNVEVVLVSLDMPKKWESQLVPFIEKKGIASKVVILNDTKQNTWIPKVDKDWSGTIPATIIYKGEHRMFYEEPFTYDALRKEVTNFLKK